MSNDSGICENRSLIFDLGLFAGQDSRFYLDKGFTVVALEANPEYAERGRKTFAREISEGRFFLIERALWHEAGRRIEFHTRGAQSSIYKDLAQRNGPAGTVEVETATLHELIAQFGVPYYIKCDLEGVDNEVIKQLQSEIRQPLFISVEAATANTVDELERCGYNRFQIVNQGYHSRTKIPFPAREGRYVSIAMNETMSGLFGLELDQGRWMSKHEAFTAMKLREHIVSDRCNPVLRYLYRRIGRMTGRLYLISQGWTDIHAGRE